MSRFTEMLKRDVKDRTGATYYTVGVISAILESDDSGEKKIANITQAIEALEKFATA